MRLTPKNWREFQHYQDRRPPWIKLHRKLLEDRTFACLPLASKALAPLLWLLASEGDENGEFEAGTEELMFRLRLSREEVTSGVSALVAAGLFSASTTLDTCLQVATCSVSVSPVTLPLSEKKKDTVLERPDGVSEQTWADWLAHRKNKRATVTATVINQLRKAGTAAGMTLDEAMAWSVSQGYAGFFPPKNGKSPDRVRGIHSGFDKIDYGETGRPI